MQEEQEPSVTDILSSIRQILSNKLDEKEEGVIEEPRIPAFNMQEESVVDDSLSAQESFSEGIGEDVLLLTPQMKIQRPVEAETPVLEQEAGVPVSPPMTPDIVEESIQPMIHAWLDKHLPQMVERIVSEEVRRIFNKR